MKKTITASAATALLVLGTLTPPAAAEMTRAEVEQIVRETILNNPSLIVEAFSNYQQSAREKQLEEFKEKMAAKKNDVFNSGSPSIGPTDADMTIVEFFDYNCGYCKKAIGDIVRLHNEDKKLRIVFKELPILSESSRVAAKWALAAQKQGKYFEFHKALMETASQKDEQILSGIAEKLKLDVTKLKKDAESAEVAAEIEKNHNLARDLGISGTPGFIFGDDTLIPGYMGYDSMAALIKDLREKKKAAAP